VTEIPPSPVLPERSPWPRRPLLHDLLGLFVLYLLLALAAIYVARQPGSIASIWLANACAVSFVVTSDRERTPALLGAAALANMLANLLHGDSLAISTAFVIPNTIEVALAVILLRRIGFIDRFSADHRAFLRVMAAGAFVAPLAGASIGTLVLQLLHYGEPLGVWLDWYVGSTISAVALLPLALSLRALSGRGWLSRTISARALALTLATIVATLATLRYLNFPFVTIGTCLVLGSTVASRLHTFALALLVVVCFAVALSFRWFSPVHLHTSLDHAQLYVSALLVVMPAQVVAVLLAKQRALGDILSAVGSRSDCVVAFADMEGVYRWVSRSRASLTGIPNDQVLGRTFAQNTSPAAYREMKPLLERAYAGLRTHIHRDVESPSQGCRRMDVVIDPACDEEGRQIGVVYCATDVTELESSRRALQQAVDQLRASNERLEQFVRIASHDLREPLNTIAQFCDLIAQRAASELSGDTQRYFTLVRNGATRMRLLLDDVLQFARVVGDAEMVYERVALDALVSNVLQSLQAQVDRSGAVIEVDGLGEVSAHPSLVSLALQNLISNAMKFVPAERHPHVAIKSSRNEGELCLSISDNGIGIAPERIRELGMPFRRLHSRRKFDGTGLGLAICKRIAEAHGGRLEIESKLGEGSVFHLILGAAALPGAAKGPAAVAASGGASSMLAG
jgi:signal transduction histidine kinase